MKLGKTIAEIRHNRGMKQKTLASLCDVTPTYLSQIENGRKDPTLPLLRAISHHLKMPLPFLFFLATDQDDVPEEKRSAYALLAPSINSFIHALVNEPDLSTS